MAERRMFAKTIIDSDAFLDMPCSAQALYFHLAMRADDDGFLNNPKKIQRMVGASDDDLKLLLAKRFILAFESGVIVIKHWRIHNYIQRDRYKPTVYTDEKAQLTTKENGAYTLCIQDGYRSDTQVRLGKDRLGQDRIEEVETRTKHGEYGWVLLTDDQYAKLEKDLGKEELDRCIRYVDESAQSNGNKNRWKDWNLVIRRCHREGWGRRDERREEKRVMTFMDLGERERNDR